MAITTLNSHIQRAVEFFQKDDIYFGIGRTTAWEDEDSPPEPVFETSTIEEPIGFKKAEQAYLVVPDEEGEIVYQDSTWSVVTLDEAFVKKARYVFISTTIRYDELPLGRYRQVGVYSGLEPVEGTAPGKFNLLPEEVKVQGILEVIDNRQDSNRQADQKETLNLIIKM